MKVQHLSPFVLFLLPALSTAFADLSPNSIVTHRRAALDSDSVPPDFDDYAPVRANPKVAPKGTQDAPVDGRDGRPHAGPWVETSAERDRKKAGSVVPSDAPSDPKIAQHLGPDGNPIPYSNDGVMDDPNRSGPKEGTRGTEGGVSGKLKDSYSSEKTPDAPKEAPPLPHSEKPKVTYQDTTDDYSKGTGDSTLGKLEVCRQCLQFPKFQMMLIINLF